MVNLKQAGQTGTARRSISLLAWGAIGLGTAFLTGCSSTPIASTAPPHDPLHGVLIPPGMPQPTNGPKASAPQADPTTIPASMSSSNPATLAATSWQGPLGRPLAIDDNHTGPPFLPGHLPSTSKTQQVPVLSPNANPKVEQIPDSKPTAPPVTPTGSWQTEQPGAPIVQTASSAAAPNAEALFKQLQDRGVLDQKQDAVPEGVRLTCYVSRGPGVGLRILEVTAADYATAVRAILQQLDSTR